jgi:hypothetical protein
VKTPQERSAEKRLIKLAEIERQVKDGSLVIRQMTSDERERNQPRPRPPRRS